MEYNLSHLIQDNNQQVLGPVQDDEALLLFALIRVKRIHNILEIGGLNGYSAKNFSEAIINGKIYTVDISRCPKVSDNHIVVIKDCNELLPEDIPDKIDMIFFDAHVLEPQINLYNTLLKHNIIDENVVLVFHDTGKHPEKLTSTSYQLGDGWVHQPVERQLVEYFKAQGFDGIHFHTNLNETTIKFRHGITVMQKYKTLDV